MQRELVARFHDLREANTSMIRRSNVIIAIVVAVALNVGLHHSSDAAFPQLPDAALCVVEPRSLDEIGAVTSSPPAERLEEDEVEWQGARAATDEEVAAITETFIEFLACHNHGDYLRQAALVTDDALVRGFISDVGLELPDELKVRFEGVYACYVFSDGRLGAVVVTSTPAEFAPLQSLFTLFKLVEGRWLIDDVPPSGVVVAIPE